LGHAYSALLAQDIARTENGDFLLRIEDIDQTRARPAWESQIYEDLAWLGLWWPEPVMRQSERHLIYRTALNELWLRGLLYPCTCTRRDIADAAAAPQEGVPQFGPDGLIYPRTCAGNMSFERNFPEKYPLPQNAVLRLDMTLAVRDSGAFHPLAGQPSNAHFTETGAGPNGETGQIAFSEDDLINGIGDIVLARRDMGTSYHLSVVVDDAAQGITHVVRGHDLFEATKIHVVLQRLLGLPTPIYHHHRLIRDEDGKRLAKRDDARAISLYRSEGATPNDIRCMVGL
jgi:glutamyl-Q tRNA(Asp) synthetase